MSNWWMRGASFPLSIVFCVLSLPVAAQDVLTEQVAIERALAQEGIAERDGADLAAADAQADVIGPLANPELEVTREGGSETEWAIQLVQPIDITGRRSALRDAARTEAEAVSSDIDRRRQDLIADVRGAFVRCASASANVDIWQDYAENLREAERVSTARAEAGDAAYYDIRRVRVQVSAAEAGLLLARGNREADCALLSGLTGLSEPTVQLTAITALTSDPNQGERPDLIAQTQRVRAADYRVSAAERARWPQISIGAGVRRIDDGFDTDYGPIVSLGVSLPLWNGGGAAVRGEESRRAALEAELAIAHRQIAAEQQATAIRASSSRNAAIAAARSRDDAMRLGTIADTAYQAGEIGVVELLDAYNAARDADLAVIAHALEAAHAAIEYDLATGRTYP